MAQFFSIVGLIFAAGVAMAPGETEDIGPRQVQIELGRWESLRAIAELEEPTVTPPGPWAAQRQVQIERSPDGLRVRVSWALETVEAGWWTGPLIGPVAGMRVESATWRGRDIGVTHTSVGEEVAVNMAAKTRGQLELVVFVPGDQLPGGVDTDLDLWLAPAVRGELRLDGPAPEGRVPTIVVDGQVRPVIDGRFWAGEAELGLRWVDADQDSGELEGPLAVAQVALGLTFGDGELRGRARVSWLLRRGQLDRVSIDTAGLGRDLDVQGANVHAWTRTGDRVDVELKDAADGRIDLDLSWTQGLPGGAEAALVAPRITPQQAYRSESFLQIARDGELEVLPKLTGWSAVARAELPDWAGGYIQGTATASYRREGGDAGASFDLLRFVPLSGPPVVVDVAAYEIATTDEGRALIQARYDVRNERASHLGLELPAGARMLGVRVNGETVTPTRDASSASAKTEAWRIPLVRSLESVKGSLSFPVEVIFISETDSWAKKESRELLLPALDAPVAVSRVRVYLPPRYANRVDLGDFHRVSDFSEGEGITYGLSVGAGAAEVARADELYREALDGWMSNDFRRAQSSIDELVSLGASSANIEGLQANLDLVQGRTEPGGDEGGGGQSAVVSRRIKDQANMRAADEKIALREKTREAEELEAQGRYDQAEQKLDEAAELGDRLAMLEQSESQEQAVYNQSLSSSKARVAQKKKGKSKREFAETKKVMPPLAKPKPKPEPAYELEPEPAYELEDPAPELEPAWHNRSLPDTRGQSGEMDANNGNEFAPDDDAGVVITTQDAESLPVGAKTSRDFTAVVDVAATTKTPGRKSRAPRKRGGKGAPASGEAFEPPAPPPAPITSTTSTTPAPDPNAVLAGPVATASAVSVHVPAIGQAVLYQHMLLPEGEALTVHLEARRHKKSKRRSK